MINNIILIFILILILYIIIGIYLHIPSLFDPDSISKTGSSENSIEWKNPKPYSLDKMIEITSFIENNITNFEPINKKELNIINSYANKEKLKLEQLVSIRNMIATQKAINANKIIHKYYQDIKKTFRNYSYFLSKDKEIGNKKETGKEKEMGNKKETGKEKEMGNKKETGKEKETIKSGNKKETGKEKETIKSGNKKETGKEKETIKSGNKKETGKEVGKEDRIDKISDFFNKYPIPPLEIIRILQNNNLTVPEIFIEYAKNNDSENKENYLVILKKADDFETNLINWLHSKYPSIKFKTQNTLIKEQIAQYGRAMHTPDILFNEPVLIKLTDSDGCERNHLIRWIDAKNYTLVKIPFILNSINKQADKYLKIYGPGALAFHYGMTENIHIPNILMLDSSFI